MRKTRLRRATGGKLLAGLAALGMAAAQAAAPRGDLVAAYVSAIESNAAYRSAVLQYSAALEAQPAARQQLMPQLGAQADYNWVRQKVDGTYYDTAEVNRSDSFERFAYGAALTQTIFRFDQFLELKKADAQVGQARLALADAKDELQLGVAEAYFALLGAQESLIATRAEKEAVQRQLEQTRGRFESGLVSEADLTAAQARRDLVLADEISAVNGVQLARTQLELIAGRFFEHVEGLPPDVALPPLDETDVQTWIDRAMQHNLPLLLQTVKLRLAELETRQMRAKRLPAVELVGSYAFFNQDGGISGARDDLDERIGVTMTIPIFTSGLISTGVRYADKIERSEQAMLDQARAQAVQDVRAALLNAKSALARSHALDQAVRSAIAAEQAAQVGYDVGTRTQAELLTAVRERYSAQRDYALARYAYVMARLKLKRAAGQMTAADLDEINTWLR